MHAGGGGAVIVPYLAIQGSGPKEGAPALMMLYCESAVRLVEVVKTTVPPTPDWLVAEATTQTV